MAAIQKIFPCLWFDGRAEEAARFYVSIFDNSRITRVSHYTEAARDVPGGGIEPGSVMTVQFELEGVPFTALNAGPEFKFNEAISLQVMCDSQAEIDRYWDALSDGGDKSAQVCGWLKDKFGLSWQIVPSVMPELTSDRDPARADRVMRALMKMKKLDLAKLQAA